jgi:hypothetical protein
MRLRLETPGRLENKSKLIILLGSQVLYSD